ncbi:MAG: 1-deoxy-D-xylulose-5-phosphate reductoisomerase [Lactimicrobium massiliense]|nr:1-deoxy-D-xylulose-5-phosphate reductoisomerase [Lactimicrobium massiliense]MDD6675593.1 1-deoxy-D-xylulose-5-phosphate reductoisomerase [Lactimicrobium massiliense]
MTRKRIVLLGASGSIGTQTIDIVLQHPDLFEIKALSVGHNIDCLRKILAKVKTDQVCVMEKQDAQQLSASYPHIRFVYGDEGLLTLAERDDYDVLVNALVGFVGFAPTLAAIQTKHNIALANKETLVVGGELIKRALQQYGVSLYPIDSEHSAIFQCLQGNRRQDVKRLWITCSGGAFRNKSRDELQNVTVEDALAHPNWSMGAKITVDCANLMNKGFEVTEAHWLFDMPYDDIKVLMHPQSIVHSMVEYVDHSIIAQLGAADMRLPIQYALTWPARYDFHEEHPLDLATAPDLHFENPDTERFPLLALAYEAGKKGGNLDAIMNAANEAANLAFRQHKIPFLMIEEIVISAVHEAPYKQVNDVQDLLDADAWGRQYAQSKIEEYLN